VRHQILEEKEMRYAHLSRDIFPHASRSIGFGKGKIEAPDRMQPILSGARWNKFEALPHRIFPPKVKLYQEKKLILLSVLQEACKNEPYSLVH
jgi:hypothetical protein